MIFKELSIFSFLSFSAFLKHGVIDATLLTLFSDQYNQFCVCFPLKNGAPEKSEIESNSCYSPSPMQPFYSLSSGMSIRDAGRWFSSGTQSWPGREGSTLALIPNFPHWLYCKSYPQTEIGSRDPSKQCLTLLTVRDPHRMSAC